MKPLFLILFGISVVIGQHIASGKQMGESAIEKYISTIERLKKKKELIRVTLPNKSQCGGALDGYYLNNQLVLMETYFGLGCGDRVTKCKYFVSNGEYLKIIKHTYTDPCSESETHIKYAPEDTTYIATFSQPLIFRKKVKGHTDRINTNLDVIERLCLCGEEMKQELQEVTSLVDSLMNIKEVPYICEKEPCGDNLYWTILLCGTNNINLLIEKLDDTTSTQARSLFGYNYTEADIAFSILQEIIHNIPTFELLGVQFDKEGCGYCSYWQHLNKNLSNRIDFKKKIRKWYKKNEDKFVWEKNEKFYNCDCRIKHPIGGHYILPNMNQ